ncbi:MAG: hypothetical protein COB04_19115 [Gammaproteobacteria bacterium]|nr:MAG: hypothetical protein COB04_19115 [Gammaproteobacteria bacterium]
MYKLLANYGLRGVFSIVLLSASLLSFGAEYSGDLINGVREGQGTLSWDNGDVYEGQFLAGKRHGKGRLVWSSGEAYEGDFLKGKRTGFGSYTWNNGQKYLGQWLDDQPNGQGFCYDPQGSRRCQFLAGKEVAFEGGRRDQLFNGLRPKNLGVGSEGKFAPCPNSPNCASSQEDSVLHYVEPIPFVGNIVETMDRIRNVLEKDMDRIVVRVYETDYIYAEAQTAALHFVDDVEIYCVNDEEVCHIRSASRIGYSDLGVNLSRVKEIRQRVSSRADYNRKSVRRGPRR